MSSSDPRRLIPRTDDVLADPRLRDAGSALGRASVVAAVRAAQERARAGLIGPDAVVEDAVSLLPPLSGLRSIVNATGVVVHTNLGRAPLSVSAIAAVTAAAGYTDLEYDVHTGRRGERGASVLAALRDRVPAGADALVVNNGAAALLLAVTALTTSSNNSEVVVSRGELVEIGDGFRLPDLMTSTGARLREVGTTNRTHRSDYADVIGAQTAAIVKVHPSNFRVEGFTGGVGVPDLAGLGVPVVVDIGSGLLGPSRDLPKEPDATTALREGATLVTASADKLLGGPQAGLVFGDVDVVQRLRRHPLFRALRVDKLTLAALEATVRGADVPVSAYRMADPDTLAERVAALADRVGGRVRAHDGVIGGGGAPGVVLPGWAVAVPAELAQVLRSGIPSVVGRVDSGELLLDLRCVPPQSDADLAAAVLAAVRVLQN